MPTTSQEYSRSPHMQQVGDYVPIAMLGEGAVAVVYRARPTSEGASITLFQAPDQTDDVSPAVEVPQTVALKVLKPDAVNQPAVLASFQYEARVLTRLNHDNILRVYDTGDDEGRVYLAMELIEGTGFDNYLLEKKRLPEADAVSLASQLGDALDYLHGQDYLHRDVKPANLMVTNTGRIILCDFGTVIRISDGAPYEVGLYGTPAFLSPEQANAGGKIDGRADLYSLGVMLYLMLTGRKPFYGSRDEVLDAHQQAPPPPPSDFAAVSPDLEKVILKAIAKDPADRYQTGAEFVKALNEAELLPPPESKSLTSRLFGWMRGS